MSSMILNDVLVIDFTQALAGPYCTLLLSYNGARVIKIERPASGDMLRSAAPFTPEGLSIFWASVNSNKESCALDLKNNDDLELIKNIIRKADILVENFRPGVMEKLGLGYDDVKKINPTIIYTSISGFGTTGPMAHEPGFDLIGQGYSGMMPINGDVDKDMGRIGFPIGDISAGMWGYMSTMTAYCGRLKTGVGAYIDISMLDGLFAMMPVEVTAYTKLNELGHYTGNIDPAAAPFGAIPTQDSAIIVAVLGEKLWLSFCQAVGKIEWYDDPYFKTGPDRIKNRAALQAVVQPLFKQKRTAEWQKILTDAGIPNGVINDIKQACEQPQIAARNMLVKAGDYLVPGNPMKISSNFEMKTFKAPETIGASTDKIRKDFK
ncbi:CaiB/BaiF CoA transferase family protein [Yersinia aldovae]|uniref:CaiB/BaiF CoA transferase family protein n=1 Tax=Yersinia aldovae TaxID=29483 RepID=UPI0005DFADAB|nr:CoA transferase [Yersinia aldovae]CNI92929.1 Formyl-coenzyme A transferase [Yersinia aldovae]